MFLNRTDYHKCHWLQMGRFLFFIIILEKEKSQKRKLYLSTVLFLDRYRNRSMSNKSRITAPVFAWLGFQRGVRLEPDRCFQVEVYWKGTVFLERHRRGLHLNWPRTPSAQHPTESRPLSWPPRQKPNRRSHCWINSWLAMVRILAGWKTAPECQKKKINWCQKSSCILFEW